MTHDIERQLMQGMRERVAEVSLTGDIVGGALRRTRRRRVVFQAMTAVVLAGGLAAAAVVVAGGEELPQPQQQAQPPQQQEITLASVVEASGSVSYRLKVTTKAGDLTVVGTGAYDPAARSGYAALNKINDGRVNQILINGVLYINNPNDTWVQIRGDKERLSFGMRTVDNSIADSADPQDLLEVLRRNQAKVTETGPGAYRFEAKTSHDSPKGLIEVEFSGEAKANRDKRLATITYRCTVTMHPPGGEKVPARTSDTVIEFSDYGVPVKVEPPAKVTKVIG